MLFYPCSLASEDDFWPRGHCQNCTKGVRLEGYLSKEIYLFCFDDSKMFVKVIWFWAVKINNNMRKRKKQKTKEGVMPNFPPFTFVL